MEIKLQDELEKFNLPFAQIQESLKPKLENGADPFELIKIKSEEREKILDWFNNTSEWGKTAYEKYRKLAIETGNQKYFDLQDKAVVTSAAPWALSWVQYNIGECYEHLKDYEKALEEYKKGFSLWVEVKGWNGNGVAGNSFKRSLIILSKMKNRSKFEEYKKWFLGELKKCPSKISEFYFERIYPDIEKRKRLITDKDNDIIKYPQF